MASATARAATANHHEWGRGPTERVKEPKKCDPRWTTTWSGDRMLRARAAAVPTNTGTIAAGRVRGRAPRIQRWTGPGAAAVTPSAVTDAGGNDRSRAGDAPGTRFGPPGPPRSYRRAWWRH